MKYAAFILSWIGVISLHQAFKEFNNVLAVWGAICMLGILMHFLPSDRNSKIARIGWGFFYGPITLLFVAILGVVTINYLLSTHH